MAVPAQQMKAQQQPARQRLTLRVQKGKQQHPLWTHLYGPEGCGKSTFGAGAPDPIFIDVEQGTMNIETTRFQFDEQGRTLPNDWPELLDAVRVVERDEHPYRTLVIDTLDAVEALIWAHICKRDGQQNIDAYGFGKGFNAAVDEWRILIASLERIRARGVNVVTLSHAIVKTFKNPEGEDYDRYQLKLHEKAAGLVKERADVVLFGNFEVLIKKDAKTKRVRGVSTDARFIYTTRTAAFDAKNRHDLPESMALDWGEYWAAVQAHKPAEPKALREAIEKKAAKLPEAQKATALSYLEKAGADAVALAKLNDWTNAKLAEAGVAEEG